MTDVKTKSGSKKAISVQYTLVNEEKSHLEFIEQAPATKSGFLKISSGQHNISFQIANYSCPHCQMNLSQLQNVFVQVVKVNLSKLQNVERVAESG